MNDEYTITQEELETPPPGRSPRMKPPTWQHWKRALKWLAITVVVLGVAAAAYVFFNLSKVSVNPFSFGNLRGESRGRVNIMMLGVGDPGHEGEMLSDTNILLSVDTRNHQIAVISIPRDTRVSIPGYGYGKINNAHAEGGVKTSEKVFENTLGEPVDYYVKANFTGMKEVVDAVGGVDVNNTTLLYDSQYPCDKNQYKSCGFRLAPGKYHLDGATALKYARCRKGTCGNDFGRAARQQEIMQAVRQKATSAGTLANPIALARLVKAGGDNIETDLSVNNMMRLNQITKAVAKDRIYNVVFSVEPHGFLTEDKRGSSDLLPADGDFDSIQLFVQNIFKRAPLWMEQPTVVIQNGTTTPGLGGRFNDQLTTDTEDVTVEAIGNALTQDHAVTQIIDYTGGKKPHSFSYLKGLVKVTQATPPPTTSKVAPADFVIILGQDYATAHSSTSTTESN